MNEGGTEGGQDRKRKIKACRFRSAFCPMGQHDPRAALHLGALSAHLDPPMGRWLPAITTDAAKAMGLTPGHVDTLPVKDLRICDAATTADWIAGRTPLLSLSSSSEVTSQ